MRRTTVLIRVRLITYILCQRIHYMMSKVQYQKRMRAKFQCRRPVAEPVAWSGRVGGGPCPGVPSSLKGSDGGHNLRIMESNRNTDPQISLAVPPRADAAHKVQGSPTEMKQKAELNDMCTHHTWLPHCCVVRKPGCELGTYKFMAIKGASPMKNQYSRLS